MKDYWKRSCRLIERGRRILIRSEDSGYVSQWSCFQGGEDMVGWTYDPRMAMEFSDLNTAFAISKMFRRNITKVVSRGGR